MAAESDEHESNQDVALHRKQASNGTDSTISAEQETKEEEDDEDEDEDADDEPKLKYTRLTGNLGPVYRNGDATSSSMVAGDKMVIGTHNGNIHVLSIPSFQSLRLYNAHSASVTSVSVSPLLPPLPANQDAVVKPVERPRTPQKHAPTSAGHTPAQRSPRQPAVPAIPSNQIHIATSSIDGHVCVSSLVDPKDISLRNFARPVQAVALSPEYKSDRSYISGGLAGELILTTGVQAGVRSNANTNQTSAAAQGWLGAIGLGGHSGRDTILHSGEGTISTIKWSLSGKYVVWVNEHGIRIMRTNIQLDSADSESAWKRIGFIDKPNRRIWEEMSGVWKARAEWVDDESLESDEDSIISMNGSGTPGEKPSSTLPHKRSGKQHQNGAKRKIEKLVIGWGDAAWVVHVDPGGTGVGRHVGERSVGSAEIIHHLRFEDCIVSGIALYTPSLLLVLAYRTRDDDDNPITPTEENTPRRGMHRRHNGLSPELKLINAATSDEIEVDALTVSRFETLSAADYHLSTMYIPHAKSMTQAQKSALEALSGGIWDAGVSAARIFSSGASIISMPGTMDNGKAAPSVSSASTGHGLSTTPRRGSQVNPNAASAGLKVFIQSPYDCVLAIKRDLNDHFNWELEHENYKDAWELLEDHPEIVSASPFSPPDSSPSSTPSRTQGSLQDFFADDSASQTTISANRAGQNSAVEKEKRRVGDMWVQQLVTSGNWIEAGKVAGRVLGTSARWEHWVWTFVQANRFDEISPYIPGTEMHPPLPSAVYELVLGHYILHDRIRFKYLLEDWDPTLFNIDIVTEAIKSKLAVGDVTEDSIEGDEQGRDWRILQDSLAKLYLAAGHQREALRCYIRLQNADATMGLIREFHLVEAIRDDIPGFILLRVSKEQLESASLSELEEASSEPIHLLVEEASRGLVPASEVVSQLKDKGPSFQPFLFFYLRGLSEPGNEGRARISKGRATADRLAANAVAEEFADLIVELFAQYDRDLFMAYLKKSQSYNLEKAAGICESKEYIPELVLILSKTGQIKRALYLIIEKLSDVSFAISFAKEQDDSELWNDLLEYSMDKPDFIRGLLEQVGTAIDPIQLVRRIPEGLEIEGLRDGIRKMVREYEIQHSISEGVAKVLCGEVAQGMDILRAGQKRGVKFQVVPCDDETTVPGAFKEKVELEPKAVDPALAAAANSRDDSTSITTAFQSGPTPSAPPQGDAPPGHCTGCHHAFTLPTPEGEAEDIQTGTIPRSRDALVGFACGHVFHLSCLLPKTSASASVAMTLQARLAADAVRLRSVEAKVEHARVIKAAVGRGCVVCRERDAEGDAEEG